MRDHADNVVIVCSIENIDPMGVHTGDSRDRRAAADADRPHLPEAARPGDRRHPRRRRRDRRLQRPVRGQPGDRRDRRDRDEPARVAKSARSRPRRPASRSPRSPPGSRSATRSTRSRTTSPARRRRASSRRSTTSSSSGRGSRSRSSRASTPALSTHMKSVGEVMAIGRTFGQAFGKALRSRELDALPSLEGSDEELLTRLETPGADRFDVLLELQQRGVSDGEIRARTGIDPWFLRELRDLDRAFDGVRTYKAVDTCAAEFEAETPYYYSAWERTRRVRGAPRRPAERDDPRLRPEPDRPGDRVRLLLRARRDDRARVRPRRGDGQLQPGDGLDRLRHVRPAVLRAAHARGRAGDRRGRAAGGRDRVLRRPDAAAARGRAWRPPA